MTMERMRYGVDAPGVVVAHLGAGLLMAAVAAIGLAAPKAHFLPSGVALIAAGLAALFLLVAAAFLTSSLVGKQRVRDRLVAALKLSGDERVLDAGCGRGLALVACAKKLRTGKAVGLDLWAAKDLSGNSPRATLANAAAEGVADRVDVETGDITRLPFADASFDAAISMTVLHNIDSAEARDRAIRELVRVLKPGGRLAIFDLLHAARYAAVLREEGMQVRDLGVDVLWLLPCRSLLAEKPSQEGPSAARS